MTQPLGMEDFFSLEAGEYLEKLAGLVSGSAAPSADEIVRFTRALRGSALMANQAPIAAGRPKPMVPSPPELIHWRGRLKR